jgi:hypothetical protein
MEARWSFPQTEVVPLNPSVLFRAARLLAAALVVVLVGGAAPASAAVPAGCVTPQFSQPFLPWKDAALYTLSPGGSFETGAPGWTLTGGARAVPGNESFYVGGAADRMSLSLPPGAAAVSAPMCIDRTYPTFRFFARNPGSSKADLQVEVLWHESGVAKSYKAKLDKKSGSAWAPVKSVKLKSSALSTGTLEPVTFRFTAVGAGGAWQIDDLYVDPFMRR